MIIGIGVAVLVLGLAAFGMYRLMNPADDLRLKTVEAAVADRNITAVERLVRAGADLEQRDQLGGTPLITACSTGQFLIAEVLIQGGANVFATDDFGVTAGRMAEVSRISENSLEGRARARVLTLMKDKGFPFPAMDRDQVLAAKAAGTWPPKIDSNVAASKKLLVGSWESADDPKDVITFNQDGTLTESTAGNGTGTPAYEVWELYQDLHTGASIPETYHGLVLKRVLDGSTNYYAVEVTSTELNLTYFGRGNTLSYKRITK
ncbi:hypothetical protein BH11PAT2_BH11PAT2_06070 [soil metagenome]